MWKKFKSNVSNKNNVRTTKHVLDFQILEASQTWWLVQREPTYSKISQSIKPQKKKVKQ